MRGGYYPQWEEEKFPPTSIKTEYFTHIYYAFLIPNQDTYQFEISPQQDQTLANFNKILHDQKQPPVKTLFSIGGYGQSSFFASMASNPTSRRKFIMSCIDIARRFKFDGIDLDWEYPENSTEMKNMGKLLEEMHHEVQNDARVNGATLLTISALVLYKPTLDWEVERSYPTESMKKHLDWINLMTYEYHGSWSTPIKTGAHAALYHATSDLNSNHGIQKWIEAGVSSGQLVMGLPLYGKKWELEDSRSHGIGARAIGMGQDDGLIPYNEIVSFNRDQNALVFNDMTTASAYSVAGTSWVGYDDTIQVQTKIKYLCEKGMRGYFIWAIDMDDDSCTISKTASKEISISGVAKIKGGYYPEWVESSFPPSSINTNYFTHIYYAFLNPNNATFQYENIPPEKEQSLRTFTTTLHSKQPLVKALFSIGGGKTAFFVSMASKHDTRKRFIKSSINVARTYGFDGIDIVWEFPENSTQMVNFGILLQEMHSAVRNEAQATGRDPILLSAAVHSHSRINWKDNIVYPTNSMRTSLDWINMMNFNYHGPWHVPMATGAHAALKPNTDEGIQTWLDAGVPKSKLIMGLPLYGRTWKLADHGLHGIGAAANGVGPGDNGILPYAEVVKFNMDNRALVVIDGDTLSAYSVAGTSWIGYDDVTQVRQKIQYLQHVRGLGGYFFWAINMDDENWSISRTAFEATSEMPTI